MTTITTPKGISQEVTNKVLAAIKAHKGHATLKAITEATGLRYRVVHNVTWRLEGSPKNGTYLHMDEAQIKRVNLGRTVEYGLKPKGESTLTMAGKYATRGSVD